MSTRGAIAKASTADGEQWVGIYNHSDSFPTGLGASIFNDVVHKYGGDVNKFIADRIDGVAGWSNFPDIPCNHEIAGEKMLIRSTNEDGDAPLFIEWVYVLEPAYNTMLVLTGCPAPGKTYLVETEERQAFRWEYVDRVHFDRVSEPSWTLIERSGTDLHERRWAESEEARPERAGSKRK